MSLRVISAMVAAILVGDRWTKHVVETSMTPGDTFEVLAGFLSITYVRNQGAAFGLGSTIPDTWRVPFFLVLTTTMIGFLGYLIWTTPAEDWAQRLGLGAVLGGALGNLYDRALFGSVTDFVDCYIAGWHWPAFNVADSFITVGAIALVLSSLFAPRSAE